MPKLSTPIAPLNLTPKEIARFYPKIKTGLPDECWEWQGGRRPRRYGNWSVRRDKRTVQLAAHRVAFFLASSTDPHPLLVCHTCDNPPCCNPAHLFLGTVQDNSDDMKRKNRHHSPRGSKCGSAKLTEAQILEIKEIFATLDPPMTRQEAMRHYGIGPSHLNRIIRGKTWTHMPSPQDSLDRKPRGNRHYARRHPEKVMRGEANGHAKLTPEQVQEIKRIFSTPNPPVTQKEIAKQYGVCLSTVNHIVKGRNWKHLG